MERTNNVFTDFAGGGSYKQNENPMMGGCYSGYTELAFQVG